MTYRKVQRPSHDLLAAMVYEQGVDAAATAFGVHQDTIRRWCRAANIEPHSVRYMRKHGPPKMRKHGPLIHVRTTNIGADNPSAPLRGEDDEGRAIISAPSKLVPSRAWNGRDFSTAPPMGILLSRSHSESVFGNRLLSIELNGLEWHPDHGMTMLAILAAGVYQMDIACPPSTIDGYTLNRRIFLPLPHLLDQLGWPNDARSAARLTQRINELATPWFRINNADPIRFIVGKSDSIRGRGRGRPTRDALNDAWLRSWVDVRFEFFIAFSHYLTDWEVLRSVQTEVARRLVVTLSTDRRLTIPAPALVAQSLGKPPSYYRKKLDGAHAELLSVGFLNAPPKWSGFQVAYSVDEDYRHKKGRQRDPIFLPAPVRAVIGYRSDLGPLDRADLRRVAGRQIAAGADSDAVALSFLEFMRTGSQSAASLGAVWEHRLRDDAQHDVSEAGRSKLRHYERLYTESSIHVDVPRIAEAVAG